jgi:hypothetical protein
MSLTLSNQNNSGGFSLTNTNDSGNLSLSVLPSSNTIVTDGLVMNLDASTWSGTGDWYSSVGSYVGVYNPGTVGAITKQSNNGGVIQSEGTEAGAGFVTNSNFASGDYTIMTATIYLPGSPPGRIVSATGNNWLLGNWNGNIDQYYAEGWISNPPAVGNTSWNIYTGTRNGANFYSFYNGSTLIDSNFNGNSGPANLSIFNSQYPGETSYSQCGFILVYDRVLSPEEITINYNAYAARFGL